MDYLDWRILMDLCSENLSGGLEDIIPVFLGAELRFHLRGMLTDLLPYQLLGVCYIMKSNKGHSFGFNGGILADKMGLGKTVQIIGAMVNTMPLLDDSEKPEQFLVVCPVALLDQCKFSHVTVYTETDTLQGESQIYLHSGRTLGHIQKYSSETWRVASGPADRARYLEKGRVM